MLKSIGQFVLDLGRSFDYVSPFVSAAQEVAHSTRAAQHTMFVPKHDLGRAMEVVSASGIQINTVVSGDVLSRHSHFMVDLPDALTAQRVLDEAGIVLKPVSRLDEEVSR